VLIESAIIPPYQDIYLKSVLLKAKSKKPGMLLLFVTYYEGGLLVKHCRRIGWNVPIYAPDSLTEPKFFELAGDLGEFYILLSPTLNIKRPEAKTLAILWSKKHKGIPPIATIYGYDAVKVAKAVIEMGGVDRRSFIKKLKEVRVKGIGSPVYEFDKTGEGKKSPVFITITGEQFINKNFK